MKTLIITGTVKRSEFNEGYIEYELTLFGQSVENPLIQCISYTKIDCKGYTEMQSLARDIYAKYYNTDVYNIVTLENINII